MFQKRNKNKGSLIGLPLLFLGLFLVLLNGAVRAEESFTLERDRDGRLLVETTVAGTHVFPFILDTGAERTVVYRVLVTEMGIEAVPFKSARVLTATGPRTLQLYAVGSISAFGRTIEAGETAALPDVDQPDVYGIVGIDLLRGQIVGIEGDMLTVHEDVPGEGWHRVDGRPVARGSLAVELKLGNLLVPALIDTGANVSVINRPAYEALRGSTVNVPTGSRSRINAAGGKIAAERYRLDEAHIGDRRLVNVDLLVADLPVFATLGARRVPAMIVGLDLIGRQGMVLDFKNWRLYLKKAP